MIAVRFIFLATAFCLLAGQEQGDYDDAAALEDDRSPLHPIAGLIGEHDRLGAEIDKLGGNFDDAPPEMVIPCYDGPFENAAMEGCLDDCRGYHTLKEAEKDCNTLKHRCNGIVQTNGPDEAKGIKNLVLYELRKGPEILDEQGGTMWVKQERCHFVQAGGKLEEDKDEEYIEGDEEDGNVEQEWDDELNRHYGLENERHDAGDFDDHPMIYLFILAVTIGAGYWSYRRGHRITVSIVEFLRRTLSRLLNSKTSILGSRGGGAGSPPTQPATLPGGPRGDYSAL